MHGANEKGGRDEAAAAATLLLDLVATASVLVRPPHIAAHRPAHRSNEGQSMAGRGGGEPPPAPTSSGGSHEAFTWPGYGDVLPVPPLSPDKQH
ncbi:hypothetical protein [Oryza sativa Japonica Group]|uniref:Os01g0112701 protein n=2 Tax=Oryza sativa subsp. japonica TaxID=39947 RepID=Q657F7_ORYSJ|nr:hypothetical protein [Oryza sativa Japonica Group]BAS70034.1 Os01g0112701 [Oryza sativa Japonica Group]